MEKCSLKIHNENNAILYCYECKIYMCNKCEKHHSELFENHHSYKLENYKDIKNELFTGLCKENNHSGELKFFCKSHEKLICAECITKFKGKEYGQHTDCNICLIEDVESEKKEKLKKNIKSLEDLSANLENSIKELKKLFENIENDKESIKSEIQKIFTKLRNIINDREDELMIMVDNKFNESFFNEEFIKESEKLPKRVEISLKKGKLLDNNWKNNKLNSSINDCLNIQNNINEINKINKNMNICNSIENKISFLFSDDQFNIIFEKIKNFGCIYNNFGSEIINGENFHKINEWIGEDKQRNFILLYSAKKDGCNIDIFHEKCDGKNDCLIICKVKDSDIIGGYLSTKIQKKEEYSEDKKAFVFNLTKNIIKKNKNNYSKAFKNFNNSSYFFKFGECNVFALSGDCLSEKNSEAYNCGCQCNFDTQNSNLFNKNESTKFLVEDFEVFKVIE